MRKLPATEAGTIGRFSLYPIKTIRYLIFLADDKRQLRGFGTIIDISHW